MVGTGTDVSPIYPRSQTLIRLIQTEVDLESVDVARQNVSSNNLQERITITATSTDGPILVPLLQYVRFALSFRSGLDYHEIG